MAHSSRAFELPGSTVVQFVRCDRPVRRMSCSLVRRQPRSGRASGHAFAAAPRRHQEARRGVELQRRWQRGMRLIEEGFLDEASVAELADRLGVGPRHLLRLFLRHTGAPPSEIAATRRVQVAKRLTDQTRMGLSDIAIAAGFRSVRRFNDAFRATYGRPPSSFRRSVQRSRSPDRTQPLYEKALESREWPLKPESELQPSSRA